MRTYFSRFFFETLEAHFRFFHETTRKWKILVLDDKLVREQSYSLQPLVPLPIDDWWYRFQTNQKYFWKKWKIADLALREISAIFDVIISVFECLILDAWKSSFRSAFFIEQSEASTIERAHKTNQCTHSLSMTNRPLWHVSDFQKHQYRLSFRSSQTSTIALFRNKKIRTRANSMRYPQNQTELDSLFALKS